MKKLLLTCVALCLLASSAFASGLNLTVTACPNNAGSSNDAGTLDCAGGQMVTMLATFQPAEAIADLVGIDAILYITVNGDVNTTQNFWDISPTGTGNPTGMSTDHRRPATVCAAAAGNYTNTWNVASAGSAYGAAIISPSRVRVAAQCQRPSILAVVPNQKLFGFQMTIDATTSIESGTGAALGCTSAAAVSLEQIAPGSQINLPTTVLTSPDAGSGKGQVVLFNGAAQPVSTSRHSWGQLKSLYR